MAKLFDEHIKEVPSIQVLIYHAVRDRLCRGQEHEEAI
jgi:hypothetical protein